MINPVFTVLVLVFVSSTANGQENKPQWNANGYQGFPQSNEENAHGTIKDCADVQITKMGCYRDHLHTPRPLPTLIVTDRDPSSSKYDGHIFDWNNPSRSMSDLACRCAKAALKKSYTHFSLQYFGECWSGKKAASTYSADGPARGCLGSEYKPCDDSTDTPCTGVEFSNYVYKAQIKQTAPPGPSCVDRYPSNCKHYASIGLCNDRFPEVLEYCLKSCGLTC